jgi:hypothetical protein
MKQRSTALFAGLAILVAAAGAGAIPALQIYIDGAVYDPNTETWTTTASDFDLWVVGDVDAVGTIHDVKLAVSFFGLAGNFSLTPATTGLITDPSLPAAPIFYQTGTGGHPTLPAHGIFNDATLHHWDDYRLGDFTLTDSPIGDYDGSPSFPIAFPDNGQVNVYHVHVDGWYRVHFDAYDHTVDSMNNKEKFWKSPFSHDGEVPVESGTWSGIKAIYRP